MPRHFKPGCACATYATCQTSDIEKLNAQFMQAHWGDYPAYDNFSDNKGYAVPAEYYERQDCYPAHTTTPCKLASPVQLGANPVDIIRWENCNGLYRAYKTDRRLYDYSLLKMQGIKGPCGYNMLA